MGNTISTDYTESDIWWPTPHTNKETIIAPSISKENKHDLKLNENILPKCKLTRKDLNLAETQSDSLKSEESTECDDSILRRRTNEEKLQLFRSELEKKHLARREAIAERSREILFLRTELAKYKRMNEDLSELLKEQQHNNSEEQSNGKTERRCLSEEDRQKLELFAKENGQLRSEIQELKEDLKKSEELIKQNTDLRVDISTAQKELQAVNVQILEFEKERDDYKAHVVALKDVIHVSKKLLEIRETQLKELKTKIADIETSLAEHEASMLSTNLKNEYERQLRNMRALRTLYEERQAATKAEKELVASQLADMKKTLEDEQKKNSELQERVDELENNVSEKYDKVVNLESQLGLSKAEYRGLEAEMSVINQLFSQILLTFNNDQGTNLDKLIKLLEENHDLLTNIVVNEESEAMSSALPKVLLDLINRVNSENENSADENHEVNLTNDSISSEENLHSEQQSNNQINSAEEIVNKLPKVWRVLIELLRQQGSLQQVNISDEDSDPCYKSVETPKGPKLVLSVSKTFIRLKDLILEKKSLEKEMMRLKQLNTHLEVRLQDQEKRLELVSSELSKTWHVVGRMQRQHQQLHTHEKILRYELAQKRKMLTELKDELEYCREKWEQAREKNSSTEEEWKKLRSEFASRKAAISDDLNNSGESGYSDDKECSSDDDTSFSLDEKTKTATNDDVATVNTSLSDPDKQVVTEKKVDDVNVSSDSTNDTTQLEEACGNESVLSVPESSVLDLELDKTDSAVVNQRKTTVAKCIPLDEIDFDNISSIDATSEPVSQSTESMVSNTEHPEQAESGQSSSSSSSTERTPGEILSRREARLQKLEEQCKQLVTKVTNTSHKSTEICSRLETLHEQYGNEETERK